MSNANKPSNTPATPSPATPTPASAQAKPTVVGDAKPAVVNGAAAPAPAPMPTNGQAAQPTGASDDAGSGSPASDNESDPLMFCIVVGSVKQFKTAAKAEEYLNGPDAPSDYTVIRGRVANTKRKITLRG